MYFERKSSSYLVVVQLSSFMGSEVLGADITGNVICALEFVLVVCIEGREVFVALPTVRQHWGGGGGGHCD